ncbi:Mediator of RNA polymerase II transcription subunit [Trichinella pseudospiralis]
MKLCICLKSFIGAPFLTCLFVYLSWIYFNLKCEPKSQYKLSQPPACLKPSHEWIRLKEILSFVPFHCKRKFTFGNSKQQLTICAEDPILHAKFLKFSPKWMSFTNSLDSLYAEESFLKFNKNATAIVYSGGILPTGREHIADGRLDHRIGFIITESMAKRWILQKKKYERVLRVFQSIVGEEEIMDVLKLDCTTCWDAESQLGVFSEMADANIFNRVRVFVLVIHFKNDNPSISYKCKQWGECKFMDNSCRFTLGFVKFNANNNRPYSAPVAGIGSYEDEMLRLSVFFKEVMTDCKKIHLPMANHGNPWTACEADLKIASDANTCNIVYFGFGYGQSCTDWLPSLSMYTCKFLLFDPVCHSSANDVPKDVQLFRILAKNLSVVESYLPKFENITILFVNLEGGEWEFMEKFLDSDFKTIRQLIVRINFWTGEEAIHLRALFTQLYLLKKLGWSLFHAIRREENCDNVFYCRRRLHYELGYIQTVQNGN